MFLSPGATYDGMPAEFAYPAAFGDLLAAFLALLCIVALIRGLRVARPLLWIFTIVGSVDLINAIALATIYDANDFMGPAYWIPAFWVPALIGHSRHRRSRAVEGTAAEPMTLGTALFRGQLNSRRGSFPSRKD